MSKTNEFSLHTHVRQSNMIEQIRAGPGSSYYDDHLKAANLVANSNRFIHPNEIHAILMGRDEKIAKNAGMYRTSEVRIAWRGAKKRCPKSVMVPQLMEEWEEAVQDFLVSNNDENAERTCSELHSCFLCIHPYIDGNGRTARLVWNNLRLLKGMPWHIVFIEDAQEYYWMIVGVENRLFKPKYPDAY